MANIQDVISSHEKELEGKDISSFYNNLSTELSTLGYEVLINEKEKAEFVPSDRLNATVAQRDSFKTQVEALNSQLEEMRSNSKDNDTQAKLQEMMDSNNALISELNKAKVDNQVIALAKDAIDANDILIFIDRDVAKLDKKGNVVGVESEVERLRTEKPHLFNKVNNRGGRDNSASGTEGQANNINSIIRRAAGRSF